MTPEFNASGFSEELGDGLASGAAAIGLNDGLGEGLGLRLFEGEGDGVGVGVGLGEGVNAMTDGSALGTGIT